LSKYHSVEFIFTLPLAEIQAGEAWAHFEKLMLLDRPSDRRL
jgi:hypothetical protein